jgi:hypothetical protein
MALAPLQGGANSIDAKKSRTGGIFFAGRAYGQMNGWLEVL